VLQYVGGTVQYVRTIGYFACPYDRYVPMVCTYASMCSYEQSLKHLLGQVASPVWHLVLKWLCCWAWLSIEWEKQQGISKHHLTEEHNRV
jgi:hypothetical protein